MCKHDLCGNGFESAMRESPCILGIGCGSVGVCWNMELTLEGLNEKI
jgi:hypothetical protein